MGRYAFGMPEHVFHAQVLLAAGTRELMPAADLAAADPAAYAAALAKYDDTPERRRLRETRIPVVDRLWTEVVFLSPVHPHAIWRAWRDITGRERLSMPFWAIPISALPDGCVLLDRSITRTGDPIDPEEVRPLEPGSFRTAMETTPRNREWLASLAASGRSGAWFHGIPHVLAPGRVPLGDAGVIDWADEG